MATEVLDSAHFSKLLSGNLPVIAKFGNSKTCPPCAANEPVFKHFGQKYGKKCVFANVDLGKLQALGSSYRVSSMPTFIYFVKGTEKQRKVGAQDFENDAEKFVKDYGQTVFEQSKGKALGGSNDVPNPWLKKKAPVVKQTVEEQDDTAQVPDGFKLVCKGDTCMLVPIDETETTFKEPDMSASKPPRSCCEFM